MYKLILSFLITTSVAIAQIPSPSQNVNSDQKLDQKDRSNGQADPNLEGTSPAPKPGPGPRPAPAPRPVPAPRPPRPAPRPPRPYPHPHPRPPPFPIPAPDHEVSVHPNYDCLDGIAPSDAGHLADAALECDMTNSQRAEVNPINCYLLSQVVDTDEANEITNLATSVLDDSEIQIILNASSNLYFNCAY